MLWTQSRRWLKSLTSLLRIRRNCQPIWYVGSLGKMSPSLSPETEVTSYSPATTATYMALVLWRERYGCRMQRDACSELARPFVANRDGNQFFVLPTRFFRWA